MVKTQRHFIYTSVKCVIEVINQLNDDVNFSRQDGDLSTWNIDPSVCFSRGYNLILHRRYAPCVLIIVQTVLRMR